MPVTESEFQTHAELVKKYKQCTNDEQLELYGWFKQATVGDCNTERPGMFDLKGGYKNRERARVVISRLGRYARQQRNNSTTTTNNASHGK
mmetsp:Transcript_6245/g.20909  ORF Transcript_6245/g.20909 Transcript_6245/m.20909 type:complete len:91 (-) Transcript_6245:140-412(-)